MHTMRHRIVPYRGLGETAVSTEVVPAGVYSNDTIITVTEKRSNTLAWAAFFGGLASAGGLLLFASGHYREGYAVAAAGAVTSSVLGFIRAVSSDD